MTVYEALFGSPERAANTLEAMTLAPRDYCYGMNVFGIEDSHTRCGNCPLERKDGIICVKPDEKNESRWLNDWLNREAK